MELKPGQVRWAGLGSLAVIAGLALWALQPRVRVGLQPAHGAPGGVGANAPVAATYGTRQVPDRPSVRRPVAVAPAGPAAAGVVGDQAAASGSASAGASASRGVRLPPGFTLPPHWGGAQIVAYRESGPQGERFRREYILRDDGFKCPVRVAEDCERRGAGEIVVLRREECVADRVIAKLSPEQDRQAFEAMLAPLGLAVRQDLDRDGMVLLQTAEASLDAVPLAVARVAASASCEFVEPDGIVHAAATPNDPSYGYGYLWAMAKISAPAAWDIRHDASGVVVAVIDTGVRYTHEDLAENMWRNPGEIAGNGSDDDGNGFVDDVFGIDTYSNDSDPMDEYGHGTHVAGTVGAVGDNGIGVVGVAWQVQIMALKFLSASAGAGDDPAGVASDAILSINYAVANGADILSNSWSLGDFNSAALHAAIISAKGAGVIFVAAAGNDGVSTDSHRNYPSCYTQDNIVAVAATAQSEALASFSNYGATSVDIAAPGVGIYSTYDASDFSYLSLNGTSMATPLVAGCLAVLKAQFPHEGYLTLIGRLYAGGDSIAALAGKVKTGKRVNLNGALLGLLGAPTALTASDGTYSDRVVVSWDSAWGATHYRVSRATTVDGTKTALGSWQSATSYADAAAGAGTTYYYWVRAATSATGADASAFSAYDTGRVRAAYPDAWDPADDSAAGATSLTVAASAATHGPHGLSVDDTDDIFRAELTPGRSYVFESTGESDTYGELYSDSVLGSCVALDDDAGVDANFRIAYTPDAAGTCYLRVRGHSLGDAAAYVLTYWHELPPLPAPTGVVASDGAYPDRVRIAWGGVVGASHYRVFRASSSGGTRAELGDGWQAATVFDDTAAASGTTYYYWVQAAAGADGANASAFSSPDTGYRVEPLFASLSEVRWADASDADTDTYTSNRTLLFSVTCSRSATATLTLLYQPGAGGARHTYFSGSYSATAGVNPVRWGNIGLSPELAHGAYDWSLEVSEGGTLVAAEALLGVLRGQLFETAEQDGALAAPTGVMASDGVYLNRVHITWNAVAGASHYQVYRGISLDGLRTPLSGWQSAGYWNDTTALAGTTYTYWVQAAASSGGAQSGALSTADAGYASQHGLDEPRVLRQFGHGSLSCVATSPDGTMFLTGGSAGAHLFDLATGTLLMTFSGHTDRVTSVAFSPDGTKVLTGSAYYDQTAKLWDLSSGSNLQTFSGHTDGVTAVAFSPDGVKVLTGSGYYDQTARLWEAGSGVVLQSFSGHTGGVTAVAFSPDGSTVLTGSGDKTARLWDAATGSVLRTFSGHPGEVTSVAYSPSGSTVLTGGGYGDSTARLWDAVSGGLLRTFSGHAERVNSVAFSPDGSTVLTGSHDNTARLWVVGTGSVRQTLSRHTGDVTSVAFAPDGSMVLTAGGYGDYTARLWNAASGGLLQTFGGYGGNVFSVAFSPDGSKVLEGGDYGNATLWDVSGGRVLQTYGSSASPVRSVAFSPDGSKVLTGSGDGTARLWDAASGSPLKTYSGHSEQVNSVAFSSDGSKVLTGSADSTAKLRDAASGSVLQTFSGHADSVLSVAFSPDGSRVLTGSVDSTARLWDAANGSLLQTCSGHGGYVYAVAYSPDGSRALTGSADGSAKLWDVSSGSELRTFAGHTDWVFAVAFSPDGTQVLSGSRDRTARLWDATNGGLLKTFGGHTNAVTSVAFSPDGTTILSGSWDGTVRLWVLAVAADFHELTVTGGSGSGEYIEAEFATVWGNAAPYGKAFSRWEGDTQHLESPSAFATRVTMPDHDIALTAVYVAVPHHLTVDRGAGAGDYAAGAWVPVTAEAPPAGQTFAAWTGEVSGLTDVGAASTTLLMPDHDVAISATFRVPTYTLTVTDGTGGGDYAEGSIVHPAANAPPVGERFAAWAGDIGTVVDINAALTSLTMPARNVTVVATYRGYDLTVANGTGDGNYPAGRTVAITAEASPEGQVFDRWIGDVGGVVEVFDMATTLTIPEADTALAATYRPPPVPDPFGEALVYPAATMRIVASVVLFGSAASRDDSVAVYCGEELRGKAKVTLRQGVAVAALTVSTPQAGETLSFKVWDAAAETVYEARYSVAQSAPGVTLGSYPDDLFPVEVTNEVILALPLRTGWNHISLNVAQVDPSPRRVLATILGDLDLAVRGAQAFDPALPDAANSLAEMAGGLGYWVRMEAAATLSLRGLPLAVSDVAVALNPGWNSIGYVPERAGSIRQVLAGILATGAVVRIAGADGVFVPELPDSLNSLTTMRPGGGYWLKATTSTTLRYAEPGGGVTSRDAAAGDGGADPFGEPVVYTSPPLSLLAAVTIAGQPAGLGDELAAYCGEELRAKLPVTLVDGTSLVNLAVNVRQSGEPITFRLWQRSADGVYGTTTGSSLATEVGGANGSQGEPYRIAFTIRQWRVQVAAGAHGALLGPAAQWVNDGDSATAVAAVPDFGYAFERWSDGQTDNPRTVTNVTADLTLTATFRVATTPVSPNGRFVAQIDAATGVATGRGLWDLTGTYRATMAGLPLTLGVIHEAGGKLTGTGLYTVGPAVVTMPLRGRLRGSSGSLTMAGILVGEDPDRAVSIALKLNLTVDTAHRQLRGRLTGSIRANGATTPVDDDLTLAIPEPMDGTWALAFQLAQEGRTVTGTALLTLSNGVHHVFAVQGRNRGTTALLSLQAEPAARGIKIRTALTALEGGWARLDGFSGRGYGQTLGW